MKLAQDLDNIYQHFTAEVSQIKEFLTGTHKAIERKHSAKYRTLSEKDEQDLKRIIERLKDALEGNSHEDNHIGASTKVTNYVMALMTGLKHSEYLAEMTLVYLMSFQEAFLKDYLKALLMSRKEMLRSKKMLTFEEVASLESMNDVISHMADKEVHGLAYESVDDVGKYFKDKFNMDITTGFQSWATIREASYRRNIVVHNRGFTDKVYCSKTGYGKIDDDLNTDIAYVVSLCDVVNALMEFIHKKTKHKFRKNDLDTSKTVAGKPD